MRTKTLLTVAAALAVSAITSMADTTYSQNVVGYINTTIAAGKYAMIGNTLINGSDPAQTNNDVNALFSGLYSQPIDPPDSHSNTVLFVWDTTSGYSTWYYFNAADAATWGASSAGPGFFNEVSGNICPAQIVQGRACFLYNPTASSITATIIGNVQQGVNQVVSIVGSAGNGYNMLSLPVPVATNAFAAGFGLPTTLHSQPVDPPDANGNDVMYLWSQTSGYSTWYYFNATDAANWGASSAGPDFFNEVSGNAVGTLPVGAGFLLLHHGATVPWTNTFTVQ
jgi:hypothetical protein